jgi:hypothetical protein
MNEHLANGVAPHLTQRADGTTPGGVVAPESLPPTSTGAAAATPDPALGSRASRPPTTLPAPEAGHVEVSIPVTRLLRPVTTNHAQGAALTVLQRSLGSH